jgi:alkaline phosphatase D
VAGYRAFRDYYPFGGSPREWAEVSGADDAAPIYSSFRWGSAAEFFILDNRTYRSPVEYCQLPSGDRDNLATIGRPDTDPRLGALRETLSYPAEADSACLSALEDPARTLLGDEQKEWLKEGLRESDATFKFIVVGVPIQELYVLPFDRWEGYPAERQEILNFLAEEEITNVIFLATDIHGSFINEVSADIVSGAPPVAVEVVTGPIASITLAPLLDIVAAEGFAEPYREVMLDVAGVECAEFESFSYALFEVESNQVAVSIKDDAGTELCDQTFNAE